MRGAMEIALFIQNIQVSNHIIIFTLATVHVQEERAEVALFIFTKQSGASFNLTALRTNQTNMSIQERFSQTDRALEEVPTWPNVSSEQSSMRPGGDVVFATSAGQDPDRDAAPPAGEHLGRRSRRVRGLQIQAEVPNPARGLQVAVGMFGR